MKNKKKGSSFSVEELFECFLFIFVPADRDISGEGGGVKGQLWSDVADYW